LSGKRASSGSDKNNNIKHRIEKEPISIGRTFLIRDSLRFPEKIPDSRFKIDYKPGDLISDNVRKMQTEFSNQRVQVPPDVRPTREQNEQQLREQLRIAEEQKKTLKASSWEREGDWSMGLIGLLTASLLVLIVSGFILIRRHLG